MRVKTAVEAPRSDFQNEVIPMPTPPHQIALKRATEREAWIAGLRPGRCVCVCLQFGQRVALAQISAM